MQDFFNSKRASYDNAIKSKFRAKGKQLFSHYKTKTTTDIVLPNYPHLKQQQTNQIPTDSKEEANNNNEDNQIEASSDERKKDINNNESSGLKLVSPMRKNTKTLTNAISMLNQKQPPNYLRKTMSKYQTMKEGDIIRNIIAAERECDNDYETNECFLRLKIEEFNTALCTIITIVSSAFYHELTHFPNQKLVTENYSLHDVMRNSCLCFALISSVLFILFSINRYLIILKLNKSINRAIHKTTFWHLDYCGFFFIEAVIALLHPNFFNKDKYFQTNSTIYIHEIKYEINDIFSFIVLMRVYVIFRFFISISQFYTARGFRIAKLIGNQLNRLYVVKCIIMISPFTFLVVSTVISILILSFMLKIIEGAAFGSGTDPNNDYRKISNCIWNVIVTMTTVGYGDYYPITTIGRFICVFASVGGTCLTSFMVITLQNSIQFTENEEKAFNFREKIVMRNKVEKKAAIFFKFSFQFIDAKKKYSRALERGLPRRKVKELNQKMMSCFYKKIESKKKFKSLAKLYRNIYEVQSEASVLKSKLAEFQENLSDIQYNCEEMETYIYNINSVLDEIAVLNKTEYGSSLSSLN